MTVEYPAGDPTSYVELDQADLVRWLSALSQLPNSPRDALQWIEGPLRDFFPFAGLVCACGELVAGEVRMTNFLASGHDQKYVDQLASSFSLERRGSFAWWLLNREPFLIDPDNPPAHASAFELDEISQFGLRNVAGHGVVNLKANSGFYCGFVGVVPPLSNRHLMSLKLIAPVLADLVTRHFALVCEVPQVLEKLTPKQIEIARLVASGDSDKVIARTLGISEKTVRNQLTDGYRRLGVRKRTELMNLLR